MKVRATPEKGEGTGEAVVSTYELDYEVGFGWTERILPGCFADSIAAHPTIPIFYNHEWDAGPIGSGQATEDGNQLTVAFALYLGQGDLVGRVYQAMQDKALEEWSIGFWAEEITWDKDEPTCDQITQGDLAESSVCVRGANPATGTLDLNGRAGWIDGDEDVRKKEVARLRSKFNVPDLGEPKRRRTSPRRRAGYVPEPFKQDDDELVMCPECDKANDSDAGWCDQCGFDFHSVGFRPAPYHQDDDETVACPQCSLHNDVDASFCDQCGFELAGADGVVVEDPDADTGDTEAARARAWDLLTSPLGRERLAAERSSRTSPSLP